jgi:hypothetical protein
MRWKRSKSRQFAPPQADTAGFGAALAQLERIPRTRAHAVSVKKAVSDRGSPQNLPGGVQ